MSWNQGKKNWKRKTNIANYFMGIKDFSEETKLLAISTLIHQ